MISVTGKWWKGWVSTKGQNYATNAGQHELIGKSLVSSISSLLRLIETVKWYIVFSPPKH